MKRVIVIFLLVLHSSSTFSVINPTDIEQVLFSEVEKGLGLNPRDQAHYREIIEKSLTPNLFFHGTLAEYVSGILRDGLIPHREVGATRDISFDPCVLTHVYLTNSFGLADFFANWSFLNKEIRENKVGQLRPMLSRGFVGVVLDFSADSAMKADNLSRDEETKGESSFKFQGSIPSSFVFNPFSSPFDLQMGIIKIESSLRRLTGIQPEQLSSDNFLLLVRDVIKNKIVSYLQKIDFERTAWIDPNWENF